MATKTKKATKKVIKKHRLINEKDVDGLKFMGWTSDYDAMAGSIIWSNEKTEILIFGTPNWENENGETPFEVGYNQYGDYYPVLRLTSNERHTVKKQIEIYLATLKIVIESL